MTDDTEIVYRSKMVEMIDALIAAHPNWENATDGAACVYAMRAEDGVSVRPSVLRRAASARGRMERSATGSRVDQREARSRPPLAGHS